MSINSKEQQQIWARQLYQQALRHGWSLESLKPTKPPTRMQRIKRRVQDARLAVGSWIAGTNLKN